MEYNAKQLLNAASEHIARHEAEILLAHLLDISRMQLHAQEIQKDLFTSELVQAFENLVQQRASGYPLQYITQTAPFRYLELEVGPGVLIPRPETEMIVDLAIAEIKNRFTINPDTQLSLVDLGAGSGAIALAIENETNANYKVGIVALEKSLEAIKYLKKNCEKYQSAIRIYEGDVETALLDVKVDIVIANPPYVPFGFELPAELMHEPALALYGDLTDEGEIEYRKISEKSNLITLTHPINHELMQENAAVIFGDNTDWQGMSVVLKFIAAAKRVLKPGGFFICERFEAQTGAFNQALTSGWSDVQSHNDLTGRPRFTSARRS